MIITEIEFTEKAGFAPDQDDLRRANCQLAGETGHWHCGWCAEHDKPRFVCGCRAKIEMTPEEILKREG